MKTLRLFPIILILLNMVAIAQPHLATRHALEGNHTGKPFVVGPDFSQNNLEGFLYLYSTADHTLDVKKLHTAAASFHILRGEMPNLGMDNRYHWLKCTLLNSGIHTKELILNLHFLEFDHLSCYVYDEQNRLIYQSGPLSRTTFIAKKPVLTRYFAFPIHIPANQRLTIYLKIHREHSVILLPTRLFNKDAFLTYQFSFDFLLFFVLGILTLACFLSFGLYIITRQKLLLHYACYTMLSWLYFSSLEGLLTQYFKLDIPFLQENSNIVFAGFTLLFEILFTISFLQTNTYLPAKINKAARFLATLVLLLSAYVLFSPFSNFNSLLISFIGLFALCFILFLIIKGILRKKYEAFIYMVAIAPYFATMIWFALTVLLEAERTLLFYQMAYFSSIFEIVILGIGVGYKLVRDRNDSFLRLNILQKQFTSSIIQTQESERQRIAADLHDDLGGTLATISRRISDIRANSTEPGQTAEFASLEPLIRKSGDDLRRIAHNLMPPEFERIGMIHYIDQLVRTLPDTPTRYTFSINGTPREFPLDTALNIYRIVSELIQNIIKHAQAKRASVQLIYYHGHLTVLVEDDGIGYNSEPSNSTGSGIGLKNSKLRADYIGATLQREISEAGSLIILDIPYPA